MLKTKSAIGAALGGAFILGALVVAYSNARPEDGASHAPADKISTSFSDLQEEEIGAIIRAYLMKNPEVIIESVNAYSQEQRMAAVNNTKQAATENLPLLLDETTGFVAGKNPAKAKIAIVELYDYHCGYCKRAAGMVKDLVKKDADVKVIFRELPILREESGYAAEMALAARDQGKFLDMHFAMLAASNVLTKERVGDLAREHGLDVAKMQAVVDSGATSDIIRQNHDIAQAVGIDGTPAFVIATLDGSYVEVISGFNQELFAEKLAEARASIR